MSQFTKFSILLKVMVAAVMLLVEEQALAQDLSGEKRSLKRFGETEILAGAGMIYLRQNLHDAHSEYAMNFGYTFGLAKRCKLNDHFDISVKLLYERKGGKQYDDEQTSDTVTHIPVIHKGAITRTRSYDFLTFPISLRYQFGRRVRYQVGTGMYISYLLKATYHSESTISQYKETFDITDESNNDFGYSISMGVEIPLHNNQIVSIQVVNSNGLNNISKSPNPSHPIDLRTTSLFLIVGFLLPSLTSSP